MTRLGESLHADDVPVKPLTTPVRPSRIDGRRMGPATHLRRVGATALSITATLLLMGNTRGCIPEEGGHVDIPPPAAEDTASHVPVPAGGQACDPPNVVRDEFYCPSGTWGFFSEIVAHRVALTIRNSHNEIISSQDLSEPVKGSFRTDNGCLVVYQPAEGAIPQISEAPTC